MPGRPAQLRKCHSLQPPCACLVHLVKWSREGSYVCQACKSRCLQAPRCVHFRASAAAHTCFLSDTAVPGPRQADTSIGICPCGTRCAATNAGLLCAHRASPAGRCCMTRRAGMVTSIMARPNMAMARTASTTAALPSTATASTASMATMHSCLERGVGLLCLGLGGFVMWHKQGWSGTCSTWAGCYRFIW